MEEVQKWWMKHLDAGGISILSSDNMSDKVLYVAKDIILKITSKCPEIRELLLIYECFLVTREESVAVVLGLDESNPGFKYGCTLGLPQYPKVVTQLASVVEWENPIGSGNYNPDMGVFVHELGHAIVNVIPALDSGFHGLLKQAYEQAMESGKWANEQASKNEWEYWAEGVRIWYYEVGPHKRFDTRDAFKKCDPGLTNLLGKWLPEVEIPQGY